MLQQNLEEQAEGIWRVACWAGSCVLFSREVVGTSWILHSALQAILFFAVWEDLRSTQIAQLRFLFGMIPLLLVHSENRAALPFLSWEVLCRNVLVVSPFLVKAVAQEGGMEICVIHRFCLKYQSERAQDWFPYSLCYRVVLSLCLYQKSRVNYN